jgi:hypothetical protein
VLQDDVVSVLVDSLSLDVVSAKVVVVSNKVDVVVAADDVVIAADDVVVAADDVVTSEETIFSVLVLCSSLLLAWVVVFVIGVVRADVIGGARLFNVRVVVRATTDLVRCVSVLSRGVVVRLVVVGTVDVMRMRRAR